MISSYVRDTVAQHHSSMQGNHLKMIDEKLQ